MFTLRILFDDLINVIASLYMIINPEEFAFDIGKKAIKRCALVLMLGHNLSKKIEADDFNFPTSRFVKNIYLIKPDNKEGIDHYRKIFNEIQITSSVREFVELWAIFLDRLYELIILCLKDARMISNRSEVYKAGKLGSLKKESNFKLESIEKKITYLKDRLGIYSGYDDMFTQVAILRHCYAHYAGYMPQMYANTLDGFTYKWIKFITEIKDEVTGEIKDITYSSEPVDTLNESVIQLRRVEEQIVFQANTNCLLSIDQIEDIMFAANHAISELRSKFISLYGELLEYKKSNS